MEVVMQVINFILEHKELFATLLGAVIAILKLTAWGKAKARALELIVDIIEKLGAQKVKDMVAKAEPKLNGAAKDALTDAVAKADPAKKEPGTPSLGPLAKNSPPGPAKKEAAPGAVSAQPLDPPRKLEGPVDVNSLPNMSEGDRARCQLPKIQVNMVRPVMKNRPIPSAIINLQPVQVGERIPNTRVLLIGVSSRGIAIEIEGTGKRFQIRY